MRIAIGGFQHETNTFAPSRATYERFVQGGLLSAAPGTLLFAALRPDGRSAIYLSDLQGVRTALTIGADESLTGGRNDSTGVSATSVSATRSIAR